LYLIDLQVTFECDTPHGHWSQSVVDLEVKDRMISFKAPNFPYAITSETPVHIRLRQKKRSLGVLKYAYLPMYILSESKSSLLLRN
jgi:hypothetical protein